MRKDVPLEGIRGLAAITVVLWHTMLGFFPERSGAFPEMDPGLALTSEPWFGLLNGGAAVTLFFVLSAYVLTRAFFLGGDTRIIVRGALKRWPRLAGPVLATTLFSFALFHLGAYAFTEAGKATGSPWLQQFAFALPLEIASDFKPSLKMAFLQGAYHTFLRGDSSLDSSLWTMRYEFVGSFVVFGLALLLHHLPRGARLAQLALIVIAMLLCHAASPNYVAFPVGLALALFLPRETVTIRLAWAVPLLLVALVCFGFNGRPGGVFTLLTRVLPSALPFQYVHMAAAVLTIWVVETCPALRRRLSGPWARWLGDLSFPLYLVHVLILCSVGARAYLAAAAHAPGLAPAVAGALATFVVSVLAALPLIAFNGWWVKQVNRLTSVLVDPAGRVEHGPSASLTRKPGTAPAETAAPRAVAS